MRFELLSAGTYLPTGYWTESAPGTLRTEIEIGPGDGRFLVEAAARKHDTVWVGMEMRIGLAARLAARPDLPPNVRVHACDARWVIEHLVASEAVDAYHAYFPDPWWKKRHHKRRLFTAGTARAVHRTLKRSGSLYLLTDVEMTFREAAARLGEAGLAQKVWTRAHEDPAQSSYERKYRQQRRRLFEARFEKE